MDAHHGQKIVDAKEGLHKDVEHQEKAEIIEYPSDEVKKVRWKLDLVLIPILAFCYMLQFLDKQSLSYSTIMGLIPDLGLVGTQFSWTASIFYFGYFVWSIPTTYLIVRFPIGKYLAVTVLLWGCALTCHAACQNFGGLMAARFFLGITEAGVGSGFSLIVGMFYTREEQPLRQGLWFMGNSVASIIGGVTAYGIGGASTPLASWRLMFLIFGAMTIFWSFVMVILVPDTPKKVIFLSQRESDIALYRVLSNKTGVKNNTFKKEQLWEALRDPQAWCMTGYIFSVNIANGGLSSFGSLVIAGFGYKGLDALLIQMPSGVAQLGFIIIGSLVGSYLKNARIITMFCFTMVSVCGIVMMYALDPAMQSGRMAGFCLMMAFVANMPLGLSLISSNVGGFTKKSVVNSMVFIAYCIGNIIGPQFFYTSEAPDYPTGITASLCGFCLGCFFLFSLRLYLMWENRRRNRKYGVVDAASNLAEDAATTADSDLTDKKNTNFRYMM